MSKAIALLLVLCMGAVVSATPTLTITNVQYDATAGKMSFVLVWSGTAGEMLSGLAVGVQVTGAGSSQFGADLTYNQYRGSTGNTRTTAHGAAYTFADTFALSTCQSVTGSSPVMQGWAMLEDEMEDATHFLSYAAENGEAGAHISLTWDKNTNIPYNTFIHVQGDSLGATTPIWFDNMESPHTMNPVADLRIGIPEPATMGLLGLGLVGLVIRRRK